MNIDYHNTRDDALTEVLDNLQIEGQLYCVNDMKKPWAVKEFARQQIYFYAIEYGRGRIRLKKSKPEIAFGDGDLVLIMSGEEHLIYNGSPAKSVTNNQFFGEDKKERHFLRMDGGGRTETKFICGAFIFKAPSENSFIKSMPPVIHIKSSEQETQIWLKSLLELLSHEAREAEAGSGAMINRLTEMIFVQALRIWIKNQKQVNSGLLVALKDKQISLALNLLHQNPARNWTVAGLAAEIGMSRSPFAAKFTKLVGEPPLKYLSRWRMKLAADHLQRGELNISHIARQVGFETVAAFSKNFKKQTGKSPREFRKNSGTTKK